MHRMDDIYPFKWRIILAKNKMNRQVIQKHSYVGQNMLSALLASKPVWYKELSALLRDVS